MEASSSDSTAGNYKNLHTLRVKPINNGVFSLTCVDGGLFHDGIFGKSFRDLRLCPIGKLSSIGGYFFSSGKVLYLGSFVVVGASLVSTTADGGFSAGLAPTPGETTLRGSELRVQSENSEKVMHIATRRVRALQKRLGIIATGGNRLWF